MDKTASEFSRIWVKTGFCFWARLRTRKSNRNTICQGLQNSHWFPVWSLHLMKISVPGAISLSLGTDKSLWGPNLKNKVGAEAIRSVIYWFLPSFLSICELVHCFAKRCIFSSTNKAVYLWFIFSMGPKMHTNSCCW